MSQENKELPQSGEKIFSKEELRRESVFIVGVIGPKGIGKDTALEAIEGREGIVLSVGKRLRELINKPVEFAQYLNDKKVMYEEENHTYTGDKLVHLVEERLGKGPVPQPVAAAIIDDFVLEREDGVIFLNSGPHSTGDLKLLEGKGYAQFGFVYIAPRGNLRGDILESRIVGRGRGDDQAWIDQDAKELKERDRARVAGLLTYIREKNYLIQVVKVDETTEKDLLRSLLFVTVDDLLIAAKVTPPWIYYDPDTGGHYKLKKGELHPLSGVSSNITIRSSESHDK